MRLFLLSLLFTPTLLLSQNNIEFVENKGQWNENVNFRADIEGGVLWIESNAFTFDFVSGEDMAAFDEGWHGDNREEVMENAILRHHAYKVSFEGANDDVEYVGFEVLKKYNNYFIGNDKSKWAGNVSISKRVFGKSLYDGIDIESYSKDGHLKYDLIVHPGVDPSQIKMIYNGADVEIIYKELAVNLSVGRVYEHAPIAYQLIDDNRVEVACNFSLNDNAISFDFPNGYNTDYELIIDPELIFSTYSGSTASNYGFTATYDEDGFFYGGGIVFGIGYPTTLGAFQENFSAMTDIGLSKYTEDGSEQVFATYLGGTMSDYPHSLMVDSENNLVVYGSSASQNYPISEGAYDEFYNGGSFDIIITKFNEDGSDLLASTYLGGSLADGRNTGSVLNHNYGDAARGEVFVAANDQIFIASNTFSDDMPTTAEGEQQTHQGNQDGCAFLFNATLDTMIFGTYIGGSGDDACYSIKKEGGVIILAGGTSSIDFPISTDAYQTSFSGGSSDGFVITLTENGSIDKSTFIGTDSYDQVYFTDFGVNSTIFIAGQTTGAYPVSDGVYSNDGGTQFVQELELDLSASILSTVFGTGGATTDISLTAFMVDQCGHAYVSGFGPTAGLPVTDDAFQSVSVSNDFYFIVFETDFVGLLYATFFGGANTSEHVDGGTSRFDKDGIIYQGVCACGSDFPTTENAYSPNSGGGCNLGSIKMDFNLIGSDFKDQIGDTLFCVDAPYLIPFQGAGDTIAHHYWTFGDGGSSDVANPEHAYEEPGIYEIEYVVIDSNSCFITDTADYQIEIAQKAAFSFSYETTYPSPCTDTLFVDMAFTGTSADSLIWNMDDGTFFYEDSISYFYTTPGEYTVTLTAMDIHCDHSDVLEQLYTLYDQSLSGNLAVPNVFSPNNDGQNDEFQLFNSNGEDPLEVLDYYEIDIYNRWGKKVFESGSTIKDWVWDGTVEGNDADEGIYFYVLTYNNVCEEGQLQKISGYVTLVR